MRANFPVRPAVVLASVVLATTMVTACGGGDGGSGPAGRRGASGRPTLVFTNSTTDDVSLLPGIGTSADANVARPGGSIRATGDTGACVGVARNGAVTRIALEVTNDKMTVGTPPKCTDAGPGPVRVNWAPGETSGTRRLDATIPGTQLCVERRGHLEAQARLEAVGTAC